MEVFAHGATAVIDDFRALTLYSGGKKKAKKLVAQDKGQKAEVRAFLDAVRAGGPWPIPGEDLFDTSRVTFKVLESLRTGGRVTL